MKKIVVLAFLAFLTSCTARYQVTDLGGASAEPLAIGSSVYIVVPHDGAYGSTTYSGSGQTTAQAIAKAFAKYAGDVEVASGYQDRAEALEYANRRGHEYVVLPTITHWEQRATEWSGRPSRMGIRISIYRIDGALVDSAAIEGRSRIMSFTSTSPESLLRDPLKNYVKRLY